MFDLFKNGFWSTINNNFNDVKHQIREYKKASNALEIEYDYTIYQTKYKGKGAYVKASDNEIFIVSENKLLTLKKDSPGLSIKLLKTTKTNYKIKEIKIEISDFTEEKINNILQNKFIANATIYSSFSTSLINNPLELKKKFEIENKYNLAFKSHIQDTIMSNKLKKIAELELKIKSEENQLINDNKNYYLTISDLQQEKNKLQLNLTNYELNEVKKNIIDLEKKVSNSHVRTNLMIPAYKNQLAKIKSSKSQNIKYSGQITYIEIIK